MFPVINKNKKRLNILRWYYTILLLGCILLFFCSKNIQNKSYLTLAKYFLDQRGKEIKLKMYPEGSRFAIYNGFLAGVSISGDRFFYPNPLACNTEFAFNQGSLQRKLWFGVACCPGNVTRFLPSVPGYQYAQKENNLYVNLFIAGKMNTEILGNHVEIAQKTNYPWDGNIKITVKPEQISQFIINIRIPNWAQNRPVPGDLYRYLDITSSEIILKVNDVKVPLIIRNGFAQIDRFWDKGDKIKLELPMTVKKVVSNKKVKENAVKIAFEKGPLVFCAEEADNGKGLFDILVDKTLSISEQFSPNLLNGIQTIKIQNKNQTGKPITLIPYYAWNHRGIGEMVVWLNN